MIGLACEPKLILNQNIPSKGSFKTVRFRPIPIEIRHTKKI
jgi:hypothetical protein